LSTELHSIIHDQSKYQEKCSSEHNINEYTNMNMNFVDSQSSNSQCSDSLEDCTILVNLNFKVMGVHVIHKK